MSTLIVRDIQGYSANNFEINITSDSILDVVSELKIPTWNNSNLRPSTPEIGMIGFNIFDGAFEIYDGTKWLIAS